MTVNFGVPTRLTLAISLYMATPTFITNLSLTYNVLKTFEDSLVDDIEVPELDECSKCSNKFFYAP